MLPPNDEADLIELTPEEFAYESLSHQNLPFQSAIAELLDNAISKSRIPFVVEIWLEKTENGRITVAIADKADGITKDTLIHKALKLGGKPESASRLNEHGFGLKNALCALTKNKLSFSVITRDAGAPPGTVWLVKGPFRNGMRVESTSLSELDKYRMETKADTGTVVVAQCSLQTAQTVSERVVGSRPTQTHAIVERLSEH